MDINNQYLTPGDQFLSVGHGRTQYVPTEWNLAVIPRDKSRNGPFITYNPQKGMGIGAAFIKSESVLSQKVTLYPGNNWLNLNIESQVSLSAYDASANWGHVRAGWQVMFAEDDKIKRVPHLTAWVSALRKVEPRPLAVQTSRCLVVGLRGWHLIVEVAQVYLLALVPDLGPPPPALPVHTPKR